MKNVIRFKKGENSFIQWIKQRIKNNLNFLAIAEGETGIGKSWALLSIAWQIDNSFEPRQVAFSFREVMSIINSEWFPKKDWKIILFDEAQTSISNRSWQSLTNKLMNYLISTFRHQNIILLMTSPYSDFLDNQTMKLMHCKFDIKGHDRKKKLTKIRPLLLQYNSQRQKTYYHSLFVIRNGKYNKLINWYVPKPPKHLIDPYEKDKIAFTDRLNKEIMAELDSLNHEPNEKSFLDQGTTLQRQAKELYVKHKGNIKAISKELHITIQSVYKRLGNKENIAELDKIIENP